MPTVGEGERSRRRTKTTENEDDEERRRRRGKVRTLKWRRLPFENGEIDATNVELRCVGLFAKKVLDEGEKFSIVGRFWKEEFTQGTFLPALIEIVNASPTDLRGNGRNWDPPLTMDGHKREHSHEKTWFSCVPLQPALPSLFTSRVPSWSRSWSMSYG